MTLVMARVIFKLNILRGAPAFAFVVVVICC